MRVVLVFSSTLGKTANKCISQNTKLNQRVIHFWARKLILDLGRVYIKNKIKFKGPLWSSSVNGAGTVFINTTSGWWNHTSYIVEMERTLDKWLNEQQKQTASAVRQHQTKTPQSNDWGEVIGHHLPGVGGQPEKDQAGHSHLTQRPPLKRNIAISLHIQPPVIMWLKFHPSWWWSWWQLGELHLLEDIVRCRSTLKTADKWNTELS